MKRVVFVLVVVSIGMSNFSKLIAREIIPRDVSYIVQDDRLCLSAKAILDSIKIATEEDTIKLGSRYVTGHFVLKENNIDTVRCKLIIKHSVFKNNVNFDQVCFKESVICSLSIFKDFVSANTTTFNKDASFIYCTFELPASFNGTNFKGISNFSLSKFDDFLLLANSTFQHTDFKWSKFRESVFIDSSLFKTKLEFYGSVFSRTLFLRGAIFHDSTKLGFVETDFRRIVVNWDQIRDRLVSSEGDDALIKTYISFENSFRQQGLFVDLDACYYERRLLEMKQKEWYKRGWDWLFRLSYGFGTKPFRVWLPFLFIFVLFSTIYTFFFGITNSKSDCNQLETFNRYFSKIPDDQIMPKPIHKNLRYYMKFFPDALLFSLISFLTAGLGNWKAQSEKQKALFWVAAIEGLCGWFLLAMFIISLARVYIR